MLARLMTQLNQICLSHNTLLVTCTDRMRAKLSLINIKFCDPPTTMPLINMLHFCRSTGGEINCRFGPTLTSDAVKTNKNYTNSFLSGIDNATYPNWQSIANRFGPEQEVNGYTAQAIQMILNRTIYDRDGAPIDAAGTEYNYESAGSQYFAIRTCNSFWNPQVTISETNVDSLYLGMTSQATEREDTIITPDLRGKVYGPLHFSRRDLMAVNMQRARDHGLPDFNSARAAYGLGRIRTFQELNPLYGIDPIVTKNIEDLRDVYNNDIVAVTSGLVVWQRPSLQMLRILTFSA